MNGIIEIVQEIAQEFGLAVEENGEDHIIISTGEAKIGVRLDGDSWTVDGNDEKLIESLRAAIEKKMKEQSENVRPTPAKYSQTIALREIKDFSSITLEDFKAHFCPAATDQECLLALMTCKARGLNPVVGDCFFVKYQGKNPKLELLVSKNYFLKKADAHPDFEYLRAGIVVQKGDEISRAERAMLYPGEKLIGGWAEVKRKARSLPTIVEIAVDNYRQDNRFWKQTPGEPYMIRKTAITLGLKESFPSELGGLYEQDEIQADPRKEI